MLILSSGMKLPEDFPLERYFAEHEFTAPHLLCCSDCETITIQELLQKSGDKALQEFLQIPLMYSESLGDPDLRKDIAALYETIDASQILVDAGAAICIYSIITAALQPGDHLIVQFPCYTSLTDLAKSYNIEISLWNADPDNNWNMDLNDLEHLIKDNTKMVIVNSPNNPTGYLMEKEKFNNLIEICKKHELLFLSDEVYRGLENDDIRLPAACDLYENAISLGVMSKSYGLAGLRLGWFATRCKWLYDKVVSFKDYTTICVARPSEYLSRIALSHGKEIVQRNTDIVQENIKIFDEFVNNHSDLLRWNIPRAGPVGFMEILNVPSADEFCEKIIAGCGVLLAPGSMFHVHDRNFVRVGLGRKSLPQVVKILNEYLNEHKEELVIKKTE